MGALVNTELKTENPRGDGYRGIHLQLITKDGLSVELQIRLKSKIHKSSKIFSDNHFKKRSIEKNALAISSFQSKVTPSYNSVEDSYNKTLSEMNDQTVRPDYWGGFTFIPYYFEFWQGHKNRLNKRRNRYRD